MLISEIEVLAKIIHATVASDTLDSVIDDMLDCGDNEDLFSTERIIAEALRTALCDCRQPA